VLAVALAVVCATVAVAAPSRPFCGVERWSVKTLQDRPRLLPVQTTSVAHLTGLRPPAELRDARSPLERRIFRVIGTVTLVGPEDDGDLHLVLAAGGAHMIAESPNPACTIGATPIRRTQMAAARRAVRPCHRASVTGVAFWDYDHGQTGVAPNAIELHPILAFRCLGR
jgi:hypothetical protein